MIPFLPCTSQELSGRGWDRCDFILVSGDAYVDHPSFGAAIIGRVLEAEGFRVGIIPQPDWRSPESLTVLGRPRLGFLVTAGNLDSMVANYTAAKKPRRDDAYSPGGEGGQRPDRASIVYANLVRRAYKRMPIMIGGIEASLRRLAHYDYWSNSLRRSLLLDSKADLLVYGMAEKSIVEIARRMDGGEHIREIKDVPGTVVRVEPDSLPDGTIRLPEHDRIKENRRSFTESFSIQLRNTDPFNSRPLYEAYGTNGVLQLPPQKPLEREEFDRVYALPFTREPHPMYTQGVPAIEEVRFSLVSNRGCFGSCSFCALTFHQGRVIQARSHESLIEEAEDLTRHPGFKGYIHDVGGPTANFRHPSCKKQLTSGTCTDRMCLFPKPCPALDADHSDYVNLLKKLRSLPGVKKVFIRSGIRFDYLLAEGNERFLRELCEHHVSGQLKVAPEHVSFRVLEAMGKPDHRVYLRFKKRFDQINTELGKKQYMVPYFISSHPGSTLEDAVELALFFKEQRFIPQQVQDFYPTPGTISTCMYHTGIDPRTMKKIYVPTDPEEKRMQRALLQFNRRENAELVRKALIKAGRKNLIGHGRQCLVPPAGNTRGKIRRKHGL
jgi:uncharacterized radical SAM protein YgiQ